MVGETCNIVLGEEVKTKLLEGSKETAQAVSTTFGPYGRNVAITMKYNVPKITKDGASVAGFINFRHIVFHSYSYITPIWTKSSRNSLSCLFTTFK
jgi:chaperonin GroEL (HSP60 family)